MRVLEDMIENTNAQLHDFKRQLAKSRRRDSDSDEPVVVARSIPLQVQPVSQPAPENEPEDPAYNAFIENVVLKPEEPTSEPKSDPLRESVFGAVRQSLAESRPTLRRDTNPLKGLDQSSKWKFFVTLMKQYNSM